MPTRADCFRLIDKYEVMDHIRDHCCKVADVAVFIAERLVKGGAVLDVPLIEAASLLHDIAKMPALKRGMNHAELGASILEESGFPAVAGIVRQHVRLGYPVFKKPVTEAEIVNYADKRVLDTRIVSISERFEYIRARYGGRDKMKLDRIDAIKRETEELECKIFSGLAIGPADIRS